jgi:hypothetical protein
MAEKPLRSWLFNNNLNLFIKKAAGKTAAFFVWDET